MNESGEHNQRIRQGIKLGMILFILSEFMFFFAFFWAYLHSSTNPSIWIAHAWPPLGQATLLIESISLPFLNTLLLLTSGFCVTLAHKFSSVLFTIEESLINLKLSRIFYEFNSIFPYIFAPRFVLNLIFGLNFNRHSLRVGLVFSLALTIILALVFTNIQYHEYVEANFNISDGIFASCFYLMTGFHGIHVIVGTVFLIACFIQLKSAQSFYKEMTGLDCAIWYWHFVDVVWLFLYVIVYLIADDAFHHEMSEGLLCYLYDLEKIFNNFSHGCITHLGHTRGYALPNQLGFNPSATTAMSEIIWLHDYIMFFIIVIFFVVLALFYGILKEYTVTAIYEYYLKYKQNRIDAKFYESRKNNPFLNLNSNNDTSRGGSVHIDLAEIRNTGF
jgi:heme/copper-type cytochrome/quinol oxidase subunit 3